MYLGFRFDLHEMKGFNIEPPCTKLEGCKSFVQELNAVKLGGRPVVQEFTDVILGCTPFV